MIDRTYDNGMLDIMNGVMVPPEGDIYNVLAATSTFSSFLKYANMARIQALLQNPSPTTCEYQSYELGHFHKCTFYSACDYIFNTKHPCAYILLTFSSTEPS